MYRTHEMHHDICIKFSGYKTLDLKSQLQIQRCIYFPSCFISERLGHSIFLFLGIAFCFLWVFSLNWPLWIILQYKKETDSGISSTEQVQQDTIEKLVKPPRWML